MFLSEEEIQLYTNNIDKTFYWTSFISTSCNKNRVANFDGNVLFEITYEDEIFDE